MLNKIGLATLVVSIGLTVLVAQNCKSISDVLNEIEWKVDIFGIKAIPFGYLAPGFLIAILTRAIKLHDRISDLFHIRAVFDVSHILVPLAGGAGVPIDADKIGRIHSDRQNLMRKTFYRFASSSKPEIDEHLVVMALDRWFWFWVLVEGITIGIVALVLLLVIRGFTAAAILATGLLVFTIIAAFAHRACVATAYQQVKAILEIPGSQPILKAAFSAV